MHQLGFFNNFRFLVIYKFYIHTFPRKLLLFVIKGLSWKVGKLMIHFKQGFFTTLLHDIRRLCSLYEIRMKSYVTEI